ncbi:MAG TPA: hypothetical protein VK181_01060 [Rhizobium sp.]|nr:hypothetical protein [Rhizobium sp.]
MHVLALFKESICDQMGELFPSLCPAPWYSYLISADAIIALSSALFGAFVGGAATYVAERRLARSLAEEELKSKLTRCLLELVLIGGDLRNLADTIRLAKAEAGNHPPDTQLWQLIYKFAFSPSVPAPDFDGVDAMVRLRDRALVEDGGWVLSNYQTLVLHVANFNDLVDRYESHMKDHMYLSDGKRFFRQREGDAVQATLVANIAHHANFIAGELPHFIQTVERVQKRLFSAADAHFGSAEFLRLGPRQDD